MHAWFPMTSARRWASAALLGGSICYLWRDRRLGARRRGSPDDQKLADVLNRRGVELGTYPRKQRLAGVAIVLEDTHLDQLVREQVDVDLVQYGGCQAVMAHAHDRMQPMRLRAEVSALGGSQGEHDAYFRRFGLPERLPARLPECLPGCLAGCPPAGDGASLSGW